MGEALPRPPLNDSVVMTAERSDSKGVDIYSLGAAFDHMVTAGRPSSVPIGPGSNDIERAARPA